MEGKNLYYPPGQESRRVIKRGADQRPCVFVSHSYQDESFARELGNFLKKADVDIWLDLDEEEAAALWKNGDREGLTREIERGIGQSTHLLALVTPRTQNSWWVPFEIGQARALGKELAFIYGRDKPLNPGEIRMEFHGPLEGPEYFSIGDTLQDAARLCQWLSKITGQEFTLNKRDRDALDTFIPLKILPFRVLKIQ